MTNTDGFHPRFSRPFEVTLAGPTTGAFFDTLEASWGKAKTKRKPLNVTSDKLAALLTTTHNLTQDYKEIPEGTIMAQMPSALRPIGSRMSKAAGYWNHYLDVAENGEKHLSNISKVIKVLNGIPEPTDADDLKAATEIYEELSMFHQWIETCKGKYRNYKGEAHPLYRAASLRLERSILWSFDSDLTRTEVSRLEDAIMTRLEEVIEHDTAISEAEVANVNGLARYTTAFGAGVVAGAAVGAKVALEIITKKPT